MIYQCIVLWSEVWIIARKILITLKNIICSQLCLILAHVSQAFASSNRIFRSVENLLTKNSKEFELDRVYCSEFWECSPEPQAAGKERNIMGRIVYAVAPHSFRMYDAVWFRPAGFVQSALFYITGICTTYLTSVYDCKLGDCLEYFFLDVDDSGTTKPEDSDQSNSVDADVKSDGEPFFVSLKRFFQHEIDVERIIAS